MKLLVVLYSPFLNPHFNTLKCGVCRRRSTIIQNPFIIYYLNHIKNIVFFQPPHLILLCNKSKKRENSQVCYFHTLLSILYILYIMLLFFVHKNFPWLCKNLLEKGSFWGSRWDKLLIRRYSPFISVMHNWYTYVKYLFWNSFTNAVAVDVDLTLLECHYFMYQNENSKFIARK